MEGDVTLAVKTPTDTGRVYHPKIGKSIVLCIVIYIVTTL